MPEVLSSWGLSPTFRVFIFLSGIVGVMVFLLYNEHVKAEFKDHERTRAQLYAHVWGLAISDKLPDEDAIFIFETVINDPKVNIPLIVTDAWGNIIGAKGPGVPEVTDTSSAAQSRLRDLLVQMDAVNEPVRFLDQAVVSANLYYDGARLIIADDSATPLLWAGESLPVFESIVAVPKAVSDQLARLQQQTSPRSVRLPASKLTYLYLDAGRFVIADRDGEPLAWGGTNMPTAVDTSAAAAARLRTAIEEVSQTQAPQTFRIKREKYIHYGDSELIGSIEVAPFVTVGVLLLFALIGYAGFRNIRRSEQRSIWVGMAKETAHQLGTPLSSLSGWLELMASRVGEQKSTSPADLAGVRRQVAAGKGNTRAASAVANGPSDDVGSVDAIVREMQKDMGRLNQIASRFSQIGSIPELKPGDVTDVLNETVSYFKNRGPQFGRHAFSVTSGPMPSVPINTELLGWAFENLLKNAMDAIGQKDGAIDAHVSAVDEQRAVQLTIADNGRGIEADHVGRVFEPGFSTKKRGWGLGLAFVRRIVEEYHGGNIRIAHTAEGEGTTFEIILPTAQR